MSAWLRTCLYRITVGLLRLIPRFRKTHYRLVIIKLDRLGDAVLSLGAVRLLIRECGSSSSLLVVSPIAEPLFRQEFPGVALLVMPPFCSRFWPDFVMAMTRHAARLRAIQTEQLVILRHQASDYLHGISSLMEAGEVHASLWEKTWERTALNYPGLHPVPYPEQSCDGCLELEAHRRIVQSVLSRHVEHHEILPALNDRPDHPMRTLLVCPMTGSEIRQYPAASLARALRSFIKAHPDMPITFCLPAGAPLTPWLQALKNEGIESQVDWQQPEDFQGLRQLISQASLVLAPDSAPAHLAVAMGKPGVFVLGGGHHGMFAPWWRSRAQTWLTHPMDCFQCRWNCIHPEPRCISHIPPDEVASALLQICSDLQIRRPSSR